MTREEVLEKVSKKREEFISWYHEFHQILSREKLLEAKVQLLKKKKQQN